MNSASSATTGEMGAIMNTKMEFPTEWTMPDEVEDREGRVIERRDDILGLAAGDQPGTTGVVNPQDSVYRSLELP